MKTRKKNKNDKAMDERAVQKALEACGKACSELAQCLWDYEWNAGSISVDNYVAVTRAAQEYEHALTRQKTPCIGAHWIEGKVCYHGYYKEEEDDNATA